MKKQTKIAFGFLLLTFLMFAGSVAAAADFVGVSEGDSFTFRITAEQDGQSQSADLKITVDAVGDSDGSVAYVNLTMEGTVGLYSDSDSMEYGVYENTSMYEGLSSPNLIINKNAEKSYLDEKLTYDENGVLEYFEGEWEGTKLTIERGGGIPGFPLEVFGILTVAALGAIVLLKRKKISA